MTSDLHLALPTRQLSDLGVEGPRLTGNILEHAEHLSSAGGEVLLEELDVVLLGPLLDDDGRATQVGARKTGEELQREKERSALSSRERGKRRA